MTNLDEFAVQAVRQAPHSPSSLWCDPLPLRSMRLLAVVFIAFLATSLLPACGGGGDQDPEPTARRLEATRPSESAVRPPSTTADTAATPQGTLVNGGTVTSTIATAGEAHSYLFAAESGQSVLLSAVRTSGNLNPWIRVYRPNGTYESGSYAQLVAQLSFTASSTGTYTVVISDGSGSTANTGGYEIHYVRTPGANEQGELINAGIRVGEIDLGDLDSFTFSAESGQSVLLSAVRTSGNLNPWIRVYRPNGTYESGSYAQLVAQLSFTASSTGTYTVVISDGSGSTANTGGYEIHYVRTPGANEHGQLINARTQVGEIGLGDIDSFTFWADSGQAVLLSAVRTSGNLNPWIRLYLPDGRYATGAYSQVVAGFPFIASSTGIYTVVVSDGSGSIANTGGYELRFVRAPGPSASEHGGLIEGGARSEKITAGDIDTFMLYASQGTRIDLTITRLSGTVQPYLRLLNPAGTQVATHFSSTGNGSLSHTANAEGIYLVIVTDGSASGALTGEYKLGMNSTQQGFSYAALGDSFSSGEGLGTYTYSSGEAADCHRSSIAYPTLLKLNDWPNPLSSSNGAHFNFLACSGATTMNMNPNGTGQYGEPPQLDADNAVDATRDLVTLTIGGNDAQFSLIATICYESLLTDCPSERPYLRLGDSRTLQQLGELWVNQAVQSAQDIYTFIRGRAPNAFILAGDYPLLFGTQPTCATSFTEPEREFVRNMQERLNEGLRQAAIASGINFVSVVDIFAGHGRCDTSDPWLFGLDLSQAIPGGQAFDHQPQALHPTKRGHQAYASKFNTVLAEAGLPRATLNGVRASFFNPSPSGKAARAVSESYPRSIEPLPTMGNLSIALDGVSIWCDRVRGLVGSGSTVRLRGDGFLPLASVSLSVIVAGQNMSLGTASAAGNGVLDTLVVVPAGISSGVMISFEALGAGSGGAGRLLVGLARVEPSVTVDTDGDGIPDICDNCSARPNADQRDTDLDGYGNVCDADFDNNGIVNTLDLAKLKASFGQRGDDKAVDLDGNYIVNTQDLAIFKSLFGKPPGPAFKKPGPN